jgi:Fe-S cluster biosynthesis and repair protein YggX
MTRMVQCKKLSRELPGLTFIPFDDELGQRIYDQISAQAWQMWLEHSKMLINEYRLDLVTPEAFNLLHKRCEDFFFGEGSALPPDYQPPTGHGHGHHH